MEQGRGVLICVWVKCMLGPVVAFSMTPLLGVCDLGGCIIMYLPLAEGSRHVAAVPVSTVVSLAV